MSGNPSGGLDGSRFVVLPVSCGRPGVGGAVSGETSAQSLAAPAGVPMVDGELLTVKGPDVLQFIRRAAPASSVPLEGYVDEPDRIQGSSCQLCGVRHATGVLWT